jgi:hypothetical protein
MTSYIPVDDQKTIRSELEAVQRRMRIVLSRLGPLDRNDVRVTRTEAVLAAIERTLWAMTSGPGRLGPEMPVQAILKVPAPLFVVSKGANRA